MLKQISLYNQDETDRWDQFVEKHPDGTPYHLSSWLRTLHETYAFKPLLHVFEKKNGELAGVAPFFIVRNLMLRSRAVSLPFSDYGGPLLEEGGFGQDLLERYMGGFKRSVKNIEIRNSSQENGDFICHNYFKRHYLNLQADIEVIKKGLNKKTIQYSIRKAEQAGVRINEENNKCGIEEFSRLNTLTRKKHGVPSQPKKFFANLFANMISKGKGFILLANYDSKVVAASIFLRCGDQIHYKYSSSDPEYLSSVTPNHLLTWHAIELGVREGCRILDFGRTSPDNHGLIRYKNMWGVTSLDLPYYFYPRINGAISTEEKSLRYRLFTGVWSSLPDNLAEKIGPVIYKHLG